MAGSIKREQGCWLRAQNDSLPQSGKWTFIILTVILLLATSLRLYEAGRPSLWYDEVVTMSLARSESPAALVRLLGQIDATRAPLHPLLLQRWIALFGPSEISGRFLSVLCGVLTVALVYWVGLQAFDAATGLWGAWLCAISPLLVLYSREARMYAWLVLVTCLAWSLLLSLRRSTSVWRRACYVLSLVALVYSHPLGLLMVGALGLASLINLSAFRLSMRSWMVLHLAVALAVAPWIGRYFDHPPESTQGRLPLRFFLGMPIGFIGGDSIVLLGCFALVMYGLLRIVRSEGGARRAVIDQPVSSVCLLVWFALPPLLLYLYSQIAHPIFGPARYTLFVGPAYLLLLAHGLTKVSLVPRFALSAVGAVLSCFLLMETVYAPDLKADWRTATEFLNQRGPLDTVIVISVDPERNVEVETARYYLGPNREVIAMPKCKQNFIAPRGSTSSPIWFAVGLRDGHPVCPIPESVRKEGVSNAMVDFEGLRLIEVDWLRLVDP